VHQQWFTDPHTLPRTTNNTATHCEIEWKRWWCDELRQVLLIERHLQHQTISLQIRDVCIHRHGLQCFDTVGWAAGRASGLLNKKLNYRWETARCVVSVEICQLPHNSAETTSTTSPEQIEVMKLKRYSKAMCNKHVHSTMTSCVYHLYTDNFLCQNFLSPQYRNCSRDPDHTHLGNTHSSQD